ncbi:MAG: acetyl-CoA carboxylase biotin carboxylase subunit [Candidatus Binataceae bacterium]|nr:acetyl-CoA carboxylase biotin carboxylase subunit [Candidatus Binataceae bacterium]
MPTINTVFIANRGEIAVRINRACRDLGIRTVQGYSQADADSLAVRLADEAVCIGAAAAKQSYLNHAALIAGAKASGADAIHPGYGFLSENAEFAEQCEAAGLVYIGSQPSVIRLMGDKAAARKLAIESGVPVSQGSKEPVSTPEEAAEIANRVGYPVLVKASAGGGGRGMRVVSSEGDLRESLERASMEAAAAFGNGAVYIEKYLHPVRHIEVQVLGDGKRVVHVGERDCTIQRRHQKLVEEGPSPALTPALRGRITESAVAIASKVGYRSAGTVEYIVDAARQEFYFIEMNTRIQVEHPVTEMLSGLDLVALQIRIAAGEPLPLEQSQIAFSGHAIECRINAEDPEKGFLPRPGTLTEYSAPSGPGVRVDSHAFPGYVLPPHYDSLIAKLIVWGANREEARARMRRALTEFRVEGVPTTLKFHQRLMTEPDFISSDVHTRYVKETMWAGHPAQHML